MSQHIVSQHIARKRFGQHFLVDSAIIAAIVASLGAQREDFVLEIGPGLGALTDPLLQSLDHLHVVEIDRDIVARLKQRYAGARAAKLSIHQADALQFDFGTLLSQAAARGQRLHIMGNLPYNISTPLLFHLASFSAQIAAAAPSQPPGWLDMHFMLQKEVVERMVATPCSADYGRLSVMLQYRFFMEQLFDVPPEAFAPPPKVDSAVVRLIPLPASECLANDEAAFATLVAAAFAQRRKMLRNNLKNILDAEGFATLGIAPSARAEELSVHDYVRIANFLQPKVS
ncbi:MAG: 16S rRNA (adenine(1518)-N(6)/adenine(1519)-N(6))-dimethyltransferase RsmA [Pseudomonadota bacterium]